MPTRRWQGKVITGPDEEMLDQVVQDLEREQELERRVRETWGEGGTGSRERMTRLCRHFPTLRGADGVDPWDPERLVRWLLTSGAPTGGSRHAAKFALLVWNSREDWGAYARRPIAEGGLGLSDVALEPFNPVDAMATWDNEHQDAFRLWCELPFWP
jgi:hypothetical protein